MTIFLIIFLAIFFARFSLYNYFLIFFKKPKKNMFLVLVELILYYFIFGGVLLLVEKQVIGNTHNQEWEFYAITFCLFIVFSFPGFIYKIIWKK